MLSAAARSYAKVNLTLDVLSRRPDGYHDLASVMQTVSLHDTLVVERRPEPLVTLDCSAPGIPTDHTNLAAAAAKALLADVGAAGGVHIRLDKRIPAQAGLGGGSSNAAAALRAVSALLGLPDAPDRLPRLAAQLGSDVSFFLTGGTAAVRGRGEQVTPLPDVPAVWLVLVKPPVDIPTGPAYAALDALAARVSARGTGRMEAAVRSGDAAEVVRRMTNDFEQVALTAAPAVAAAMDDLLMARCTTARLCGSGSAVFGVARKQAAAEAAARTLALRYDQVFVCRTVGRQQALELETRTHG